MDIPMINALAARVLPLTRKIVWPWLEILEPIHRHFTHLHPMLSVTRKNVTLAFSVEVRHIRYTVLNGLRNVLNILVRKLKQTFNMNRDKFLRLTILIYQ